MASQETLLTEKPKKRGPAPTGQGTLVGTRFQPDLLAKIDQWRGGQPDLPTRPEAIRRLIEKGLENQ